MTEAITLDQTLMQVTGLTRTRLIALIEVEAVIPLHIGDEAVFRPSDLARLELLCELADLYGMEAEALAVMITVIDGMHAARRDRSVLVTAIRAEPPDVRRRIAAALVAAQTGTEEGAPPEDGGG
jgi:chaperone modulatory protein CbpM